MNNLGILAIILLIGLQSCIGQTAGSDKTTSKIKVDSTNASTLTDKEWAEVLTPQQFRVLREKGTDLPYTGKYYTTTDDGVYHCAACGSALFTSDMKFDSNCGWPSFDQAMAGGKIKTREDYSHGMIRTEILCAKCGGHLGHLFNDGPTKTGLRYCVNSTSLNFVKKSD